MEVRYAANELGLFAFLVRHNLNFKQNRGFLQADWQPKWQPLGGMKLHVQLTSGYGESLLDYNYHQTTLGLGLSIWDW
jgi:phospholipase A1